MGHKVPSGIYSSCYLHGQLVLLLPVNTKYKRLDKPVVVHYLITLICDKVVSPQPTTPCTYHSPIISNIITTSSHCVCDEVSFLITKFHSTTLIDHTFLYIS